MSKQAVFFKRALALCLCCVIAGCTFSSLSAVKAKAEGTDFFNRWFSADNDSKWWDGNSYNGLTGPDGGFYINHPDGNWQYYHRWSATGGSARLDCNGPGLTVDLNKTNRVDYAVNASKPVELWVQTYNLKEDGTKDGNTRSFTKLADIAAGETNGSVDLLKNSEIISRLTEDKKIYIDGFGFYTKSFVYGDTINVTAFSIVKGDVAQEINGFSRWFTSANNYNWWDGNSNRSYADAGDAWTWTNIIRLITTSRYRARLRFMRKSIALKTERWISTPAHSFRLKVWIRANGPNHLICAQAQSL